MGPQIVLRPRRSRVTGGGWLGIAFGLLILTAFTTSWAWWAGFDLWPDQHSAAYYRDRIPYRRTVMAVSVAVAAVAALVAGYSVFARPRNVLRGITGSVVALICLAAAVLCWILGTEAVRRAIYWAEHTTGQW
ncbi:hypothetical protein [Paenarthrobacter nicotinovorans]|uniref:hypothetical protein n=1 Tax=Paenarthrobacter nicotinovorans TaxID=29320 RepID=UPI000582FD9A|nr:hypothetical protein ANMWB30_08610 [Arthrobacter sp. MWB30]